MKFLYEPVAVRHSKALFLLSAAKRGQAIEEFFFEKAKQGCAAVEIFFGQMPFIIAASAGFKGEKQNILGECKL